LHARVDAREIRQRQREQVRPLLAEAAAERECGKTECESESSDVGLLPLHDSVRPLPSFKVVYRSMATSVHSSVRPLGQITRTRGALADAPRPTSPRGSLADAVLLARRARRETARPPCSMS